MPVLVLLAVAIVAGAFRLHRHANGTDMAARIGRQQTGTHVALEQPRRHPRLPLTRVCRLSSSRRNAAARSGG